MDIEKRTSISAGLMIASLLNEDENISKVVTKIFPVAADQADLPYIVYRRTEGAEVTVKTGYGSDTTMVEILCCAEDYDSAVDLAEAVKLKLDGLTARDGDLEMRRCHYTGGEDYFEDDAFVVKLMFKVSVGS